MYSRKKKNKKLRFCRIKLSSKCEKVFETDKHKSYSCKYCRIVLRENKLNIKKFIKLRNIYKSMSPRDILKQEVAKNE